MLFTDAQMWSTTGTQNSLEDSWRKYKALAPEAKLYIFDLAGYGKQPLDIREKMYTLFQAGQTKFSMF